jgi:1,4-dihydroxy-2-naphthoate octaprenyltransferase
MKNLIKFYRLLNILSIDVALGSVCCAAWFAEIFNVNLKPYALIALGLTVWIIYTADHLLDAKKIHAPASTERHRYHQRNFSLLLYALLIAVLVDLVFVFLLRRIVFQWGLLLSACVLVYFLSQRYLKYLKEITVALLFSFGVLLPSVSLTQRHADASDLLLIMQFVLTALLNLLLFSWFDRDNDNQDKRDSVVTFLGDQKTKLVVWFTFALNTVLMMSSILFFKEIESKVLIIFFMNAILLWIFIQPQHFKVEDRFRLMGDGIFLLPLLYLFL